MKILLVQPPRPLAHSYKFPPLSLGYLASNLTAHGYQVEVMDMDAEDASVEVFPDRFSGQTFDYAIVAITSATVSYPAAVRIANYAKALNKSCLTVIGGPHVSFLARETLDEAKSIDVVVKGEGEQALVEIAHAVEHRVEFQDIAGIVYREGSLPVETPNRPLEKDLDSLPPPDWNLFPMDLYLAPTVIASRGCPRRCIYCAATSIHRGFRQRQLEPLMREIRGLKKWVDRTPNRQLTFFDNSFAGDYSYSLRLAQAIKETRIEANWTAEMRADNVDGPLLDAMKSSGCVYIHYGIESGSQRILDSIGKGISIEKAVQIVEMTLERGIEVACSFCVGHPEETFETIDATKRIIKRLQEMGVHCSTSIVTPFPGTELWEDSERYGLTIANVPWQKYTLYNPVMSTRWLSREDIGRAFAELLVDTHAYTELDRIRQTSERFADRRKKVEADA